MRKINFCEKYISLQIDFSDLFFWQGSAAEMTKAGDRVEKYEAKSTQRD